MDKILTLKDGRKVHIRELKSDDVNRSISFFRGLPEDDREYLRTDVTKRDIVEQRIRTGWESGVKRLIAIVDDEIVADGSLESEGAGWKQHIAELRLIVARPYQHQGLGKIMARELYLLAVSKKVEEIIVKMMGPQKRAKAIFKKLGFHKDTTFHDYVKDVHGVKHDLVVMRCDMEALWQKLDDHMVDSDWQRMR